MALHLKEGTCVGQIDKELSTDDDGRAAHETAWRRGQRRIPAPVEKQRA